MRLAIALILLAGAALPTLAGVGVAQAATERLERIDPRGRARVVLVVAGDEEGAVARTQPAQRLDLRRELAHAAIDQIAGDRDGVGVEPGRAFRFLVRDGPGPLAGPSPRDSGRPARG